MVTQILPALSLNVHFCMQSQKKMKHAEADANVANVTYHTRQDQRETQEKEVF